MVHKKYNKRKHDRVPVHIKCAICDVYSAVTMGTGHIVDFSLGGLGLATTLLLAPGTEVWLQSEIPIYIDEEEKTEKLEIYVMIVNERKVMGDIYIYGTKYLHLGILGRFKLFKKLKRIYKYQHESI